MEETTSITLRTKGELIQELIAHQDTVRTTVKVYDCVKENNYLEEFDRFTDEEENEIVTELKTFFEKHEYTVNIYFTYTYQENSRAAHYFLSLSIS